MSNSYKQTAIGVIPKEWEVVNGLTYSPENISDYGLLVLRSSNIQNNIIVSNNSDDIYLSGINQFNKTIENDILICVRNGSKNLIGKNALITKKVFRCGFWSFYDNIWE